MRANLLLATAGAVLCGMAVQMDGASDIKIVTGETFRVIGIEARTSNAREMTDNGAIPKLWDELVREGVLTRIPNRTDSNIIAVYTDYESDENGLYTYVLGAKVRSTETIPQGMVAKEIPAGKYALLTSDRGPVAEVVVKTWRRIWSLPQSNPGIRRNFKTDFEIYDERASDRQNAQVEIHVGIK
jgi:predicted transcriptional regulator YdeE